MTDERPDSPSTGPGGAPAAVPAHPVVQIEIFGSTVSVNGVIIVHDGTQSLHHVAVHAAAERVAKSLGRPVRAQAIDAEGRATLIVHPDGHATDVELVETYESEAAAFAVAAAIPTPTTPMLTNFAAPETLPAGPPPAYAPSSAPGYAGAGTSVAARPASGAPTGWPSKIVRMVAVAAALVAVTGMGVLLLGNRDDSTTDRTATGSSTGSTEGPDDPSPVAASATPEPTPSAGAVEQPEVSVVALAGVNALRLTITSDTVPGSAELTVTPASGKVLRRTIALKEATTEVEFTKLAAGTSSWQVAVDGAEPQTGEIAIEGPYVPPAPTPTPVPVPPVAVPPVAVPVPPVATPAPAKPPKTTTKKAPTKPKAKPKATSKFKDKGQKGTTTNKKRKKKGPTSPVDPDGRFSVARTVTHTVSA